VETDVLIIGASASGLMCAIEAGKRGRKVIVLDHAGKAGKKILMSGGGRCNFTNVDIDADRFISSDPHFCKSGLSRYTQWDFIALVNDYHIPYQQLDLGKLFCENSAKDILDMLLAECSKAKVKICLNVVISTVDKTDSGQFILNGSHKEKPVTYQSASLVVASGGLSIPKMCATPFGYQLAEQFGLFIQPTRAGLVPFTLPPEDKEKLQPLSGISVFSEVHNTHISFKENILFTHRGLSGPAILQISSYWQNGESITINLLPDIDLVAHLIRRRQQQPRQKLKNVLNELLPKRLLAVLIDDDNEKLIAEKSIPKSSIPKKCILEKPLQEISQQYGKNIAETLQHWVIKPGGTEGYRTAEVTIGGVDCDELSSRTMQSTKVNGLYFIGEVVDVSGWLGGYNFQWAWSSGWCAGQVV